MAMHTPRRSTEHPIDQPPNTDPKQGHEHPEADPQALHLLQGKHASQSDVPDGVTSGTPNQGDTGLDRSGSSGGDL